MRSLWHGGAFGEQVVVTQDAKTMKAENVQPDGAKTSFTYALDGSESLSTGRIPWRPMAT